MLLAAAGTAWLVVFTTLVWMRHQRFGTPDHDLAIWDQSAWLLAHGESFNTVRGLPVFGFHVSPALYLYAPLYRLGAGPDLLNASMVLSLAAGAWPVFRIARHHLADDGMALVLALAHLVAFPAQWMVQETFHPEVVAITPLLFAYLAALEGRWRSFALWLAFAVSWKEDVAIAGAMIGLLFVLRGPRTVTGAAAPDHSRRWGAWAAALCLLWFVVASRVIIPAFSPEGAFTDQIFGELGGSPAELASNAVTEPGLFVDRLAESQPARFALDLTAAYGFVPLLSPVTLLVGIPQAMINLLGQYEFFWGTRVHYAAIPLAAAALAAVEGVARFRRQGLRWALTGAVAAGALYTGVMWGISPLSPEYRTGYWPLAPKANQAQLEAVVALPDADDAVSAYTWLVPHLSRRSQVYTFPNPWLADNWGVVGERRPDPDEVDWLIVEPSSLNERDKAVLRSALQDPSRALEREDVPPAAAPVAGGVPVDVVSLVDDGMWEVLIDEPQLLVARRIRP